MSFVNALRMRNLFPVNSDLGSAQIDLSGPDPMEEVFSNYNRMRESAPRTRTGLQQVADTGLGRESSTSNQPLKFGGVVGGQDNPGARIMARSEQSSQRIWDDYKKPQITADEIMGRVGKPSNDEEHLGEYFKAKNAETVANATAANAGGKGWKVVTITDPADPSKQINARVNEITGETQPIALDGGVITRMGSAKDIQAQKDKETARANGLQGIRTKAQEALAELDTLLDPQGNLTDIGHAATGWSSFGKVIPGSNAKTGAVNAKRLQDILTLELIQEMKAQSKTGATGFGQLNLRELGVLEGGASKLGTMDVDDPEYAKELNRIRQKLNMILQDAPTMKPAVSHDTNTNGNRITVINKKTGKQGTISSAAFDPNKYDLVK